MAALGWLDLPRRSLAQWDTWAHFATEARSDGLAHAVVCGMGGSSLAAAVLAANFDSSALAVLDSTDPAAVLAVERRAALDETLFVISSKSGTTVETLAFYAYFAARAAPRQFAVITEPGTPLARLAEERGCRALFPHPLDVAGRYAALSVVGLLPAALIGVDGRALCERALAVDIAAAKARGAVFAAAARAGRDKLVLRPPRAIARLADWIEQLVAESSGKQGRGVIPIVDDPLPDGRADSELVTDFAAAPLDLGAEFLRWEHITWALCTALEVNPFDQPDVEQAKALARAELAAASRGGGPAEGRAAPLATLTPAALAQAARPGDYLAILAYLARTPETAGRLGRVRAAWADVLGCATTLGFGPRYLHSTGQLHKGGPNTGLFLVITVDDAEDAAVPGMGVTFGGLKRAQARGDLRALVAAGRRVAHVHCRRPEDVAALTNL